MEKEIKELLEEMTKEKWETGKITLNEEGMTFDFKRVKETPKRWRAEEGNVYYYLVQGLIDSHIERYDSVDDRNYIVGNYFKTEEQALQKIEHLKIEQQLKDIALRLNNGVEIDWKDEDQSKWHLQLRNGIVMIRHCSDYKSQGTIYCLDSCFVDIATAEIGEDRLKSYLKEA